MYVPSTNVYGTQQATTEADDRTPPKDQTSFPKDMMPYCVCIYEWDATFVKAGLKPSNVDLFTRICTRFNIASEASNVYILSGQKLIKNPKNGQFGEFLKN